MSAQRPAGSRWTVPRIGALVVGAAYTLVGLLGFLVVGVQPFVGESNEALLGFEINGLHNVVHLVIGLAGLALSRTTSLARAYGWMLVAGYGVVFVYGLFAVGDEDLNILSLNWADNWLHLVSVLAGLAIALSPVQETGQTRLSTVQVMPAGGSWEVRGDDADDTISRHGTQMEALAAGRALARENHARLDVYGHQGESREVALEQRESYE